MINQIQDPKDTLLKILEIIEFRDDKNKFVDEFLRNIQIQSLLNLIQSLPENKQKKIRQNFSSSGTPEKIAEILKMFFSEKQIHEVIETTAKEVTCAYIKTIKETLSPAQKTQLESLFKRTSASVV